MKCILPAVTLTLSLFAFLPAPKAEPVTDIRLMAEISSVDREWVTLKVAAKSVRVPRSALAGQDLTSGRPRMIALHPAVYREMKREHLLRARQ